MIITSRVHSGEV